MNEKELTKDEQKLYEQNEAEIARITDIVNELDKQIAKIEEGGDYQELEKEIKELNEKIKNAKEINASIDAKLNEYAEQYKRIRKNKEIYKIFFSSGELRLADWQIIGLIQRFHIYFSALDNPFAVSLNTNEKKELLAGIRGVSVNDISDYDVADNVTTANNAKDSKWEIKEPQAGITEPRHRTFEWYRRWWNFHRHFPNEEINIVTAEDLKEYSPISYRRKKVGNNELIQTKLYDAVKFSKEKGKLNTRMKEYLADKQSDGDTKIKELRIAGGRGDEGYIYYFPNAGEESGPEIKYSANWADDLAYFLVDEVFRYNLLSSNPLLQKGKKWSLGPKLWAEDTPWHALCVSYFILNSGSDSNSESFKDYKLSQNFHRFNKIESGFKGGLDVLHRMLNIREVRDQIYSFGLISLYSGNALTDNEGRSTDINNLSQEPGIMFGYKENEIPARIDVDEQKKQRREKQRQLEDLKDDKGNKKVLEIERKKWEKRIQELTKANNEMIHGKEKPILRRVKQLSEQVSNFLSALPTPPTQKRARSWWQNYEKSVKDLTELVRNRLKDENKWKDSDDDYKNFNLIDAKFDKYFKKSDEVKAELPTIRAAWNKYDNSSTKGFKQYKEPVQSELYSILGTQKINDEKSLDKWLENEKNYDTSRKILEKIEELGKWVTLEDWETTVRDKIKSSKIAAKDLESLLKEILKEGHRYRINILNAWKKAGYGEGNRFSDLITHNNDLRSDNSFKKFIKEKTNGGPGYDKIENLSQLIAEKSLPELKEDCLGYILRYRLIQYIKATTDERKNWKKDIVLDWIAEAKKCSQETDSFTGITGGDNKTGDKVLDNLVRSVVRGHAEIMDLDISKSSEYNIAKRWVDAGYKVETIKSLSEAIDEKFIKEKGKSDKKGVWLSYSDPKELHKDARNHQINEEGVTKENYKEFKEKDKEKLEKTVGYLNDLIEHKLATEEQVEFHKQLTSHIATLTTTGGKKPEGEEGGKKPEGEEGGTSETTTGDKKPDAKWWQKGGYAIFWAPILAIFLIGGLGYALGWWGGKKEESEEEETTETEGGEK